MTLPIIPWRRILQIFAFVAAVFIIAYLLYLAFFAPGRPLNPNGNATSNGQLPNVNGGVNRPAAGNQNGTGGLPITNAAEVPSNVANGGKTIVKSLIETNTSFTSLAGNGTDLLYYDPVSGKFYQVDRNGTEKRALSDQTFKGVEAATWSPSRQKAVLTFLDGANIVYDFATKQQVTLPSELEDFSFSPDSSQIAAKFLGPSKDDNWLAVINSDGSQARTIEPLGEKQSQVQVNWSPNGEIVATYQQSVDGDRQAIVPLGLNDENFKTIETEGRGFVGQYDRTGTRLLYSVHSASTSYNPELYVVQAEGDSIGQNNIRLGVATWADKCAFTASGGDVYCAVPGSLGTGTGLYPELANNTSFDFVKIDLATGSRELVAQPTDSTGLATYSIKSVYLSATEDVLYFTDPNGRIRTIQLR